MRRRAFLLVGLIVNIGVAILIASFPLSTGIHWFALREMGFRELAGLVVVFVVYLCGPISAVWAIAALLKQSKGWPPRPIVRPRPIVGLVRCSFCNKVKEDVPRLLIAGSNVFICDECVEVCNDIIADASKQTPERDEVKAWPNPLQCALCRAAVPTGQGVVIANRGTLCVDCIGAVRTAHDDGHSGTR